MSELPPIPRPEKTKPDFPPIPRPSENKSRPSGTEIMAETTRFLDEQHRLGVEAAEKVIHLEGHEIIDELYSGMSAESLERELSSLLDQRTQLASEKTKVSYAAEATHSGDKIDRDRQRNWEIGEELKSIQQKIEAINRVRKSEIV